MKEALDRAERETKEAMQAKEAMLKAERERQEAEEARIEAEKLR